MQRKTRDSSLFQKLQAVHNFPLSSSPPQGASVTQVTSATANQIKVLAAAAQASAAGGDASKLLPSAFPQGSILVVPHAPGSYQTVLPVFANTAVIMPQGGPPLANSTPATSADSSSSVSSSSASTSTSVTSSSSDLSTTSPATATMVSNSSSVEGAQQSGPSQPPVITVAPHTSVIAGFQSPQQQQQQQQQPATIAIDGRLLGFPGTSVGVSGADNAQMVKFIQQAMASASILGGGGAGGGVITAPVIQAPVPTSSTSTSSDKKSDEAAKSYSGSNSARATTMIPGGLFSHHGIPFGQMMLTPSGIVIPQNFSMKVEEPVPVAKVSFESTSIELTGQVPIKKIDSKTMEVVKTSTKTNSDPGKGDSTEDAALGKVSTGGGAKAEDKTEPAGKGDTDNAEAKESGEVQDSLLQQQTEGGNLQTSKDGTPSSGSGFHGHSSADIMSAELLLSLTGGGGAKNWSPTTPKKGAALKDSQNSALLGSSPSSGDPHATSSGRKRKQKPIASAKPPQGKDPANGSGGLKADVVVSVPKPKRQRRTKKNEDTPGEDSNKQASATGGSKGKEGGVARKSKQFTPQELLEILNIPPAQAPPEATTSTGTGEG